jgi:hypothetical protein
MGEKFIAFRPNEEDKRMIERIREFVGEMNGDRSDTGVMRFALRSAMREISKKKA